MYLYEIVNIIDQKKYVGITNHIKRRWKEHRCDLNSDRHGNKHLQSAWNKYGQENFKFRILNRFDSLKKLHKAEIEFIEKNDLLNPERGYNLDKGGSGSFKHSLDARDKIQRIYIDVAIEKEILLMGLSGNLEVGYRYKTFFQLY